MKNNINIQSAINNLHLNMTREEAQKLSPETIKLFDFFDENYDGMLDQMELNKINNNKIISAIDTDKDGKISEAEIDTATQIKQLSNIAKRKAKAEIKSKMKDKPFLGAFGGAALGVTGGTLLGLALKTAPFVLTTAPVGFLVGATVYAAAVTGGILGGISGFTLTRSITKSQLNIDELKKIFNDSLGDLAKHPYAAIELENFVNEITDELSRYKK